MAYFAEDHAWRPYWEYFALFATVSLVAGIINLIPFRPEALYSDGARILQLFRGSPVSDYYRAVKSVQSSLVSMRRPRDYDIASINGASRHLTSGETGLLLRLWVAEHYEDLGEFSEARSAFAEAEQIYEESASDISADLQRCRTAAHFQALRCPRDARILASNANEKACEEELQLLAREMRFPLGRKRHRLCPRSMEFGKPGIPKPLW